MKRIAKIAMIIIETISISSCSDPTDPTTRPISISTPISESTVPSSTEVPPSTSIHSESTPPTTSIVISSVPSGANPRSIDHQINPIGSIDDPFTNEVCLSVNVYFLEMTNQYGDSLLVNCKTADGVKDFNMLIDVGQNADGRDVVKPALNEYANNYIDFAVFTHGHADHVGGFQAAMNSNTSTVGIGTILDFGYQYDGSEYIKRYQTLRDEYVRSKNTNYCTAYDAVAGNVCSSTFYLAPDLTYEIIDTGLYVDNPDQIIKNSECNDTSITGILRYKDTSIFLSGDLDKEDQLIERNPDLGEVTIMKAGHHGSNTSNSSALLDILKPKTVIISTAAVRKGSSTGGSANDHPHPEAIANFLKTPSIEKEIYLNMTMGTITVALPADDPKSYTITGSGANRLIYDNEEARNLDEKNLRLVDTYFYNNVIITKTQKTLKESVEALL